MSSIESKGNEMLVPNRDTEIPEQTRIVAKAARAMRTVPSGIGWMARGFKDMVNLRVNK